MSRVDVITSVERLVPLVRSHSDEIRTTRRLTDDVEHGMRATGLNRMLLPVKLGGDEVHPLTAVDAVERLAMADSSTGWCAVIGAGSNILAGYLPPDGAAEVFADPDRSTATMFSPLGTLAPHDDGTLGLTGRWPFVSNCLHASWIGLGARVDVAPPEPLPRLAFVPSDAVTIEDTWDVVGLRGTGSHHVTAAVTVQPHHTCAFVGDPWPEGAIWRMPVFSVILPMLAAVPLGIARAALDELTDQIGRTGVRRGPIADDPLAISDLATADVQLRAAGAVLREVVADVYDRAAAGRELPPPLLAQLYLANLHATDTAVDVTAVAHRLGGGAAAYAGSPLLRAVDDVLAVRQHFQFAHEHRIALGRVLTGVADTYPPYIT